MLSRHARTGGRVASLVTAALLAVPAAPAAQPVMPVVLHVSAHGDDDRGGTPVAPLRTIRRAAQLAAPGTTVVVGPGTYTGSFRTDASGTATAPIRYVAEPPGSARLVGDGSEEAVWRDDGDHVHIEGFEIVGDAVDGLIVTGSHVRIAGNHVHGFPRGSGILTYRLGYSLHDVDVVGNVVHDCGSTELEHGIYVAQPGGTVANNISYANAGYGIHCWHNCNRLVISNNLVFANRTGGIVIGQGDGPHFGAVAADGFVVANNIAFDNGGHGIREGGATGPGNRYLHNSVSGNAEDGLDLATGTQYGTITADPDFVDYRPDGSGDYRLRPASPLVDAGTVDGAPAVDFDGTPRPQGAGVDVGPYER